MIYAILAAGDGSRLQQEGLSTPKPLLRVGGEPLVDRLLRIFMDNDATEIWMACNAAMQSVTAHMEHIRQNGLNGRRIPLRLIPTTTPSSAHTLEVLTRHMPAAPFILTTVDTVFCEEEFSDYTKAFKVQACNGCDALMGVTTYIEDEKPLYVDVDEGECIKGFYDEVAAGLAHVSAGIYGLTPATVQPLRQCLQRGEQRMRNFQRALIASQLKVMAWEFGKVIDIDHTGDIAEAERMVAR